jgi:hypothetical protein
VQRFKQVYGNIVKMFCDFKKNPWRLKPKDLHHERGSITISVQISLKSGVVQNSEVNLPL